MAHEDNRAIGASTWGGEANEVASCSRSRGHSNDEYDVFISYRTSENVDGPVGKALQANLERFPVPCSLKRHLVRPGILQHRLRVFRDITELPAGYNLKREIEDAIRVSRWMIVVCSPETPKSEYIKEEIRQFKKLHGASHVLALLIKGEPNESFPAELIADHEPIAADIRADDTEAIIRRLAGHGVKRPEQVRFKLVAPILYCDTPDQLVKRHLAHLVRVVTLFSLIVGLVVASGAALAWENRCQRREAMAKNELEKLDVDVSQVATGYRVISDPIRRPDDSSFAEICTLLTDLRRPVVEMRFQDAEITSVDPLHEARVEKLHEIDLSFCRSLADVSALRWQSRVQSLKLPGTLVDDQDIRLLVQDGTLIPTKVECLSLSQTKITDATLRAISFAFESIGELRLSKTAITPEGIRCLVRLRIHRLELRDMDAEFPLSGSLVDTLCRIQGLEDVVIDNIHIEPNVGPAKTRQLFERLERNGITVKGSGNRDSQFWGDILPGRSQ